MKQIIRISQFIKTGKFGCIELNDSFERVIMKLGGPEGKLSISKHLRGIHYGRYEFIFNNHGLMSIQNDSFDPRFPELIEFENEHFVIKSELIKANRIKYLADIQNELTKLKIEYSIVDYWGRTAIKTEGGVTIDFNNEKWSDKHNDWIKIKNKEDFELIGIRLTRNQ